MQVDLKLFAVAKQAVGADSISLTLADGATVADLRLALAGRVPAVAAQVHRFMFAINAEYATDSTVISPQAEVACIPPVSGG